MFVEDYMKLMYMMIYLYVIYTIKEPQFQNTLHKYPKVYNSPNTFGSGFDTIGPGCLNVSCNK